MRFRGKICIERIKIIGNVSKKPLDKNELEIVFSCLTFLCAPTQTDNCKEDRMQIGRKFAFITVVKIRNHKKCIANTVVANIGVSIKD